MYFEAGTGAGGRLRFRSLCVKCVRIKCRRLCLERKTAVDFKEINDLVKIPVTE